MRQYKMQYTLVSQDAGLSAHWPGFPFVFQGRCILSDTCTVTDRLAQTSTRSLKPCKASELKHWCYLFCEQLIHIIGEHVSQLSSQELIDHRDAQFLKKTCLRMTVKRTVIDDPALLHYTNITLFTTS